jgi:hypothetical protein
MGTHGGGEGWSSSAVDLKERHLAPHVAAAFGGEPTRFSEEFLRELRANWKEALSRSRRLVFLMVVLIGLFGLLAGADVSEISFAGTRLAPSAIDVIATAIPVIVAFSFTQYWELYAVADQYEDLHKEICVQLHPELGSLELALRPPETNHPGALWLLMLGRSGPGEKVMALTSLTSLVVTFLGPFGVLIIMYTALILDFGADPVFFGISLALSAFFAARAIGFWRIR